MAAFETGEEELLSAVYSLLRNNAALIALIPDGTGKARIRDINNLPEGYAFPYVALGGHQYVPERSMGTDGQVITFTLDIWGSYKGRSEVLRVHSLIYKALADEEQDLTMDHFNCIGCTPQQGQLQPDNSTGVQLMHYIDIYTAIVQRTT